jgi:hypothetical protein
MKQPQRRRHQIRTKDVLELAALTPQEVSSWVPRLEKASVNARYTGSGYHRQAGSLMGQAVSRSWPAASKCPKDWTIEAATHLLRESIRAGHVSILWSEDYPRFVWCPHDEFLYEARLTNETQGHYHAYPLEDQKEWPVKFQRRRVSRFPSR